MDRILSLLLSSSGIYSIKSKDLNLHLHSHPEFPSLRSITDTLDYFGINNVAVKVDKTSLSQLPKKFLAHLKGDTNMDFALVHRLKNKIKLTRQNGKSIHVSIEEFEEKWNGTLLAVEKSEFQKTTVIQKFTDSNVLGIVPVICILLLLWVYSYSIAAFCFSSLSLLGLIASYLIQKESLGIGDSTIAKVCSVINSNSEGCDAVIKSDMGKILGIPLSDASIVYFAFLLIVSLFGSIDYYLLYAISGLTLVAVIYTLYVQIVELKKWCFLCLAVSFILICQFLILHFLIDQSTHHLGFVGIGSISLILVITLWTTLKALWQNSIKLSEVKSELLRFKRNSDFFFQALDKSKTLLSERIDEQYTVSFGPKHSTIDLIAITNPTCGYCNKAFEAYDYLLSKFPNDIRIDFVFSVTTDLDNDSNILASKIIEIYQQDKSKAFNAMREWFRNKEIDNWINNYGLPNRKNAYPQECIRSHNEWCNLNGIVYTPETIMGESIFPKPLYEVSDIEFFLEVIKESRATNSESNIGV